MPIASSIPFIPINPVSLICPQCGAQPGKVCDILEGEIELVHVERIKAAAAKDVAAKRPLAT